MPFFFFFFFFFFFSLLIIIIIVVFVLQNHAETMLHSVVLQDHRDGYGQKLFDPKGVIAEVDLMADNKQIINLQELNGYRNIKHLAGRGLIVSVCVYARARLCVRACVCTFS